MIATSSSAGADERVAVAVEREQVPARLGAREPALVARTRQALPQRDRRAQRRPVAVAGEREQRVEQPRQPLDLRLGELELVPHRRVVASSARPPRAGAAGR